MFRIDIHTHILPPELPKFKEIFGYGGFIELKRAPGCSHVDMLSDSGKFFRRVEDNCFHTEARLADCKRHQVDVQVLSTVPVLFSYWAKAQDGAYVARALNEHIAQTVGDNGKQYLGLGTLPMQDSKLAVEEVRRLKSLGFRGVQIGSNINQLNLSEPQFFPIFEELEALQMSLLIHPWQMMGEEHMQKYWLPWLVGMPAETSRAICSMIFGGVFARFPSLRVAFAHGGGAYPITMGRVQHGFEVRPDLCAVDNPRPPKNYIGHFFIDSLVHDPEVLRFLINKFGSDKICLGTDYPFPLGEQVPGEILSHGHFSEEEKLNINFRSALAWLGVEKKEDLWI